MSNDTFTVIVRFRTEPDNQDEALGKIGAYVDEFLSRQPGFLESWLSRNTDGTSIVHYARWRCEADFAAAGEKARSHPDLPALMAYKPSAERHQLWQHYPVPRSS